MFKCFNEYRELGCNFRRRIGAQECVAVGAFAGKAENKRLKRIYRGQLREAHPPPTKACVNARFPVIDIPCTLFYPYHSDVQNLNA